MLSKKNSHKKNNKKPQQELRISILIPAHNEEGSIRGMIESALELNYKNKEIIIIDDCSDKKDNTYKIAKEFADRGLIKLLHREKDGSKAKALNYASQYATGEILLIIDADGFIENKECLVEINKLVSQKDISSIAGSIVPRRGDDDVVNLLTRLQTLEYFVGMELGKRILSYLNALIVVSGGFGVFKKNLFFRVGKYNTNTIGEDIDITLKFQQLPERVVFLPEARADLRCPNNIKALIKQRKRWARGQLETLWKFRNLNNFPDSKLSMKLSIIDMWINDIVLNFSWIGFWILLLILSISDLIFSSQSHIGLELQIISKIEGFQLFLNYDLVSLFVEPSYQTFRRNYYYIIIMLFLVYFILEPIVFFYTIKISQRNEFLKLWYLIPLALFYRNFLRILNIYGYIEAIKGGKYNW